MLFRSYMMGLDLVKKTALIVNPILRSQVSMRTAVRSSVIVISDLGLCHGEESSKSDAEA